MSGVMIWGNNREQVLELLNAGKDLAVELDTSLVAVACGDENQAREYVECGADTVLLLPALQEGQIIEDAVPLIIEEACSLEPDVFILPATFSGKTMAARIAEALNTGLCTECISLKVKDGIVEMQRLMFGGAAVQTVECLGRPQMATIPPRTFDPAQSQPGREGVIKMLGEVPLSGITVLEKKARQYEAGDITGARVIVCAGRGIEKQEDMKLVEELARVLGAEIACTRPLSEELHWLPEDRCIGLSAKKVKPELYIGVGVSGQVQHVCGIRDARVICAVNSDEAAPIFDAADLGIQGSLYDVVPLLIETLKKA